MSLLSGVLSAAPRSLGIANPSHLFEQAQFNSVIQDAKNRISEFATIFSNGNANLRRGIEAQHRLMLRGLETNKGGPVEFNFGMHLPYKFGPYVFLLLCSEPGYSGPTAVSARPQRKFSTINAVLYAPLARGQTHITTSDPLKPPAVNPAYYAHPLDVITHVKSLQVGRRVLRTAPLDSIYEGEFEPGTDRVTDSDVETWSRRVTASDNHVVGTLAMMPQSLGGVVDTKLRVYGIRNLRVVGQCPLISVLRVSNSSLLQMHP